MPRFAESSGSLFPASGVSFWRTSVRSGLLSCIRLNALSPMARFVASKPAKWIVLLTPWRWPVALMCFSPFAGDLAAKVISALK
jgi:hypothetical protein